MYYVSTSSDGEHRRVRGVGQRWRAVDWLTQIVCVCVCIFIWFFNWKCLQTKCPFTHLIRFRNYFRSEIYSDILWGLSFKRNRRNNNINEEPNRKKTHTPTINGCGAAKRRWKEKTSSKTQKNETRFKSMRCTIAGLWLMRLSWHWPNCLRMCVNPSVADDGDHMQNSCSRAWRG